MTGGGDDGSSSSDGTLQMPRGVTLRTVSVVALSASASATEVGEKGGKRGHCADSTCGTGRCQGGHTKYITKEACTSA